MKLLSLPGLVSTNRTGGLRALAIAGTLLAVTVLTTLAHARLIDSSVSPGAILPAVPSSITLTFTEAIEPDFSTGSLIAPDRSVMSQVTIATDSDDDRSAIFTIEQAGALPPGSYALLWRVVSAVDGHATTGLLSFSAGTGVAPEIASSNAIGEGSWSGSIGRWLELIGLMSIAGATILALLAGDPALVLRRMVLFAVFVASIGALIALGNLLGTSSGAGFGSWPGFDRTIDILFDSSSGRALLLRMTLLVSIFGLAFFNRRKIAIMPRVIIAAAAMIALGSFSFTGHAAGLHGRFAVASDLIHILSAAIWGGGLLLVAVTLRRLPTSAASTVVIRFSRIAFVSFLLVGMSGSINAWHEVSGPKNLTGEDYGRVLILKIILVTFVLVTAAVNRLLVLPRLRTNQWNETVPEARSLRLTTAVELGLAICILVLAARLTSLPPADAPLTVDVASRSGPIAFSATSGDLAFAMTGELRNEADGVIRIAVSNDETGDAATNLVRVIVDATTADPLDPDGEPIQDRFDATAVPGSPGVYEFPRSRLGVEAVWDVEIIARRLGLIDESVMTSIDFRATAPQPPRLVAEQWSLPRLPITGYLALLAAAVTAAGSLWLIRRLKGLEPVTAGIMLAIAALITVGFLLTAWRSGPIPINGADVTLPANLDDPAAISRAGSLWAMQCASCHGVDGGGTGERDEAEGHAHPSVAGDLLGPQSIARTPEELFWIIGAGLGGTTMPAFDLALTDQERWDLVAYLRWLQERVSE